MKIAIITVFVIIFILGSVTIACMESEKNTKTRNTQIQKDTVEDNSTGIGMTVGGKVGIDLGGIVIPFDGSGPGIGF
jgi:uncharacterized membrane protein